MAARAGGDGAFADLVERYAGLVRSLVYALTGSWQEADELAQETFVVVWMRLGRMEAPDRFRGWVCGIARNLVLKKKRKQRSDVRSVWAPAVSGTDWASPDPSPLDRIITDEEERVVWSVLASIPETYRVPLVLFYGEHRSMERVAAALGLSQESVRKRLSRGRRMVHERVEALLESSLTGRPIKRLVTSVLAAVAALPAGEAAAGAPRITTAKAFLVGAAALVVLPLVGAGLHRGGGASHGGGHLRDPASTGIVTPSAPLPRLTLAAAEPSPPGKPLDQDRPDAILDLDFETGAASEALTLGAVVPGPERGGSRYCAAGAVLPGWPHDYGIELQSDFRFSAAMTISFDYWVGPPIDSRHDQINVSLKKADNRRNYPHFIWRPTREAWTHAEVRFTDFDAGVRWQGLPPLNDGDAISSLTINGGFVGGSPLYIDNVKLVRALPR